jgi:hypothetical protein
MSSNIAKNPRWHTSCYNRTARATGLMALNPHQISLESVGGFFLFRKYHLHLQRRPTMIIDTIPVALIIGALIFMALAVLES